MEHYFGYDGIDMSKEQFVVAYGNFSNYLVSNYGTIKNRLTGHIMKQQVNSHGYRYVQLVETGRPGSHKHIFVHRLVAYSFMRNPNSNILDCVNHKDENPANNKITNLEFCDREWNANWGTNLDRIKKSQIDRGQTTKVYAINKRTGEVYKFLSVKDAARFSGKTDVQIRKYLGTPNSSIGGEYVFCYPQQYTKKFADKLINTSNSHVVLFDGNIIAININNRKAFSFHSFKELGKKLHLRYQNAYELMKNPKLLNPYDYVFCKESQYDEAYVDYLLAIYSPKEKQSIAIAGMNINTGEIRHFKSIKQAEHELNNQSVQPYLSGKVKSAKNWVFCKEYEYSKKLLQQKAREAKPNNNFEIVILNCKTGETLNTSSSVKDLSIKYQVSNTTIRNQLNHNALSMTGQQFIYKDNYDEQVKQLFMDLYARKTRGKAVYGINIDSLEITKYDSVTQASKDLSISRPSILSVLKGESNQTNHYAFSYETYYSKFRMYLLAYIGKWGKEGFPVSSVDKQGKQTFYESVKDAANKLNLNKNNIFRVVRGERKTYKGYSWFKEDRDKYIRSLVK